MASFHHHQPDLSTSTDLHSHCFNAPLPTWDLSQIYPAPESEKFNGNMARLQGIIESFEKYAPVVKKLSSDSAISEEAIQEAFPFIDEFRSLLEEAAVLHSDLSAYVECVLSIDSTIVPVRKLDNRLQEIGTVLKEHAVQFDAFLIVIDDSAFHWIVEHPSFRNLAFDLESKRRFYKDRLLSSDAERGIAIGRSLSCKPWSNLYETLSATIRVRIRHDSMPDTEVGLSQAEEFLASPDRSLRQATLSAVNEAWSTHAETAGASLNALASWRLSECTRRSTQRPFHFLDTSLFEARITRETLDAMLSVVREKLPLSQRAMRLIANCAGYDSFEPWDRFAPYPLENSEATAKVPYREGFSQVHEAFHRFHPEMGEFMTLCEQAGWIEARTLPSKRPGAYSTAFALSGEPRTYLTWGGSDEDLRTLAHEQGHSFHTWVMRDLPFAQREYPMTLAETASNIGELLLADYQSSLRSDAAFELRSLWNDLQSGIIYLVNIPMRFEFEYEMYDRRSKESFLTPEELRDMMREQQKKWHGDTMANFDDMFWASKAHFHLSSPQFYNFPYVFGYLFASGVYSYVQQHGRDFYPEFVRLLRDTGRKSAESLAQEYLGEDLTKPAFWHKSFKAFEAKVDRFQALLTELEKSPVS